MMNIKRNFLLGVGLDAKDGHKRITKGKNFYIFGGSKNTHQFLQEKCVKFNEELKKRHKTLDDVRKDEFYDIASKIGFRPPEKR